MNKILTDNILKDYINYVGQFTVLTREEEIKLFTEYNQTKSIYLRNKLMEHNYRLVVYIVNKLKIQDPQLAMDLIQEGNIYLQKAIDNFKVELGNRFFTYAIKDINYRLKLYIDKSNILLPVGRIRRIKDYLLLEEYLVSILKRNPTSLELAEFTKTDLVKINEYLLEKNGISFSLDTKFQTDNGESMYYSEIIKSDFDLEQYCCDNLFLEEVKEYLEKNLTKRRYYIFLCLLNDSLIPSKELADKLGVSQETIRQDKRKIYIKIKGKFPQKKFM